MSAPRRLRARRVNEAAILEETIAAARTRQRPIVCVNDGGWVANSYGYPADTEAVMTAALPCGASWQSPIARLPANKVTAAGAAAATLPRGLRERLGEDWINPWDERYREARRQQCRQRLINAMIFHGYFS